MRGNAELIFSKDENKTFINNNKKAHVCRNFVKELVILFHQISAAPWGHVVSTIKRAPTEDSSPFFHSHRC